MINKHEIQLFNSSDFVSLSNNEYGLVLSKIDKNHKYNPANGALLKDVNIYRNTLVDSIHVRGKSYCIFKPDRNMLLSIFSLVDLEFIKKYVNIKQEDILYTFWKFAIIKRQYYYMNDPEEVNRCYFSTPIIILNCQEGIK